MLYSFPGAKILAMSFCRVNSHRESKRKILDLQYRLACYLGDDWHGIKTSKVLDSGDTVATMY
jgi:hypothetical protein